ncbi:MAG: glycosyltransferase family 39 protein [Candidatus Omnitrophica bacterium]|nr:glycosyltransferase family 39 protein [Candidatus Omnitrophota bacterium]
MFVFAVLPLIFTGLLWRWLTLRGFEAREALLAANVISGVLIVFSTEALSPFRQINFFSLLTFWSLLVVAISFRLLRIASVGRWSWPRWSLTWIEKVLLGMAAFIVLVVGFIALYAPPNTWDSMTYHMARVGHWRQNSSVMNYPTNIIRQLVMFPFAEYVILHLQVLTGGDRFANMVQWSAMVCSAFGVSLAAGLLGASRLGQIAAALLALTLPMGILQGSSTQNDYVVAVLVLSAMCFLLKTFSSPQRRWLGLAAASVGLAALTKGLGLLLAGAVVLAWLFFAKAAVRRKAVFLGLSVFAVMLFAGSFCFRLLDIDRNPLVAMETGGRVSMERLGVAETLANMLKSLAVQAALPLEDWNKAVYAGVKSGQALLGGYASAVGNKLEPSFSVTYEMDEDVAVNPLHLFLFLISACGFWFNGFKVPAMRWYAATLAIGALLFCVTVQWQPWIGRFHLPFFVLAMPLTAVIFEKCMPRKVFIGVLVVTFLAAAQPLGLNNTRRLFSNKSMFLFSREQLYFVRDRGWYFKVAPVAKALRELACRDVGVRLGSDEWEYPWQVLLGPEVRVEHVGVGGVMAAWAYPKGEFAPCAVIDMATADRVREVVFQGISFIKAGEVAEFALYVNSALSRQIAF